jgi:hypothetical protein
MQDLLVALGSGNQRIRTRGETKLGKPMYSGGRSCGRLINFGESLPIEIKLSMNEGEGGSAQWKTSPIMVSLVRNLTLTFFVFWPNILFSH